MPEIDEIKKAILTQDGFLHSKYLRIVTISTLQNCVVRSIAVQGKTA